MNFSFAIEYYHCCDGDMCNRCPEYDPNSNNNVPMKIIEEVFQSINCSISFPTTNAPTNLPNRTRGKLIVLQCLYFEDGGFVTRGCILRMF